ncbi:hypothetical protein RIF29_20306 [Crotalaria pallida]|uniref:Uncharacterized protein n=1 Tax=Crotalaria pallida TaxID=3830 RepID=A0AAN9F590_CROPI
MAKKKTREMNQRERSSDERDEATQKTKPWRRRRVRSRGDEEAERGVFDYCFVFHILFILSLLCCLQNPYKKVPHTFAELGLVEAHKLPQAHSSNGELWIVGAYIDKHRVKHRRCGCS